MSLYSIILPEMGEGVIEATLTKWFIKEGDSIEEDQIIAEIATDKVDSDVTSPRAGIVKELIYEVNDTMSIGKAMVILDISSDLNTSLEQVNTSETEFLEDLHPENSVPNYEVLSSIDNNNLEEITSETNISNETLITDYQKEEIHTKIDQIEALEKQDEVLETLSKPLQNNNLPASNSFYSPLVRSIAKEENISSEELQTIQGSGLDGRITKEDVLQYIAQKKQATTTEPIEQLPIPIAVPTSILPIQSMEDEVQEMDRMRKLIAKNMLDSKRISPHVTSFIEVDITQVVEWRNSIKDKFKAEKGQNFTFTPIFVYALVKAIKDYPAINSQIVEVDKICIKKNINIGMAVATQSGNLIVPVIKNADAYSLSGLALKINDLAERARINKLKPDEVTDGTYTITNIGTFGTLFGTPIINQPQSAILAVGAIQKKVSVIETPKGDTIGIRQKMYLSHSYDHRIIDGALGGLFIKRLGEYLENFAEEL